MVISDKDCGITRRGLYGVPQQIRCNNKLQAVSSDVHLQDKYAKITKIGCPNLSYNFPNRNKDAMLTRRADTGQAIYQPVEGPPAGLASYLF